jgi:hypothetical protein
MEDAGGGHEEGNQRSTSSERVLRAPIEPAMRRKHEPRGAPRDVESSARTSVPPTKIVNFVAT